MIPRDYNFTGLKNYLDTQVFTDDYIKALERLDDFLKDTSNHYILHPELSKAIPLLSDLIEQIHASIPPTNTID